MSEFYGITGDDDVNSDMNRYDRVGQLVSKGDIVVFVVTTLYHGAVLVAAKVLGFANHDSILVVPIEDVAHDYIKNKMSRLVSRSCVMKIDDERASLFKLTGSWV